MAFVKVPYEALNSRQKENYNFQKISAVLAEFGYSTMRLTDDWQGADFIALHIDGNQVLRVQLKSRLTLDKKYLNKQLQLCFPYKGTWFIYPHDEVVAHILKVSNISNTASWQKDGLYTFKLISGELLEHLQQYAL